jgi:hypothetical protein
MPSKEKEPKGFVNGGVMMKYLIVEATSAGALQKQVQQYIDQGWEPTGGLSVAPMAWVRGGITKR